jgi:hypothetical protein
MVGSVEGVKYGYGKDDKPFHKMAPAMPGHDSDDEFVT